MKVYKKNSKTAAVVFGLLSALVITGCGDQGDTGTATAEVESESAQAGEQAGAATAAAGEVSFSQAWIKATDEDMTAVFGEIHNNSDTQVRLIAAHTDVAGLVELHEVVQNDQGQMQMQERDGGFVIPAGGVHVLEPGGDHVMLMDLKGAINPGDEVSVTLIFEDGLEIELNAPAKEFAGANENYSHDHDHEDGHDHDGGGEDSHDN